VPVHIVRLKAVGQVDSQVYCISVALVRTCARCFAPPQNRAPATGPAAELKGTF
jgi:hypothetical protein